MVRKKLRPVWLAKLMLFYPQLFKISFFWDFFDGKIYFQINLKFFKVFSNYWLICLKEQKQIGLKLVTLKTLAQDVTTY